MSPNPSFSIAVEIRAGCVPVRWTVREHIVHEENGEQTKRVFWPQVELSKWGDAQVNDLEDPLDIRAAMFRSVNREWTEPSALAILNRVGAWQIVTNEESSGKRETWQEGTFAPATYRHRSFHKLRAIPVTLEDMRRDVRYWYDLLGSPKSPAKKKKAFSAPPGWEHQSHHSFGWEAEFTNTMPVSLEWAGRDPRAVIEPISGMELLKAAAWVDIASGLEPQVCRRCLTRFSSARKRTYCLGDCAHAEAVKNYKRREALKSAPNKGMKP